MPVAPKRQKLATVLRVGSKQAVALEIIEEQYVRQANEEYPIQNRMFDMLAEFFIDEQLIQAVYDIYIRKDSNKAANQQPVTDTLIEDKLLGLLTNQEFYKRLNNLVDKLNRITPKVFEIYDSLKAKKANRATIEKRAKEAISLPTSSPSNASPSNASLSNASLSNTEAARRSRIRATVKTLAINATTRRRAITNT